MITKLKELDSNKNRSKCRFLMTARAYKYLHVCLFHSSVTKQRKLGAIFERHINGMLSQGNGLTPLKQIQTCDIWSEVFDNHQSRGCDLENSGALSPQV